jgi:ankyrin repeat protein
MRKEYSMHQSIISRWVLLSALVVTTYTIESSTFLHSAARNGDVHAVELNIQLGDNVNVEDSKRNTPLHLAAQNGHTAVADILIRNGADVNIKNHSHITPLSSDKKWACSNSQHSHAQWR